MLDEFDLHSGLLIAVVLIILIILFLVYRENTKADEIKEKISGLKLECPAAPPCPDVTCPEVSCPNNTQECPKCPKCPECPTASCPKCPDCPSTNYPTVNEIINGIFPGRDQGVTMGGDYFPLQAFTESCPSTNAPQDTGLPVGSNISTIEPDPSLLGGENISGIGKKSSPEESVPEESVPEESVPEESVPEESVPEESENGVEPFSNLSMLLPTLF